MNFVDANDRASTQSCPSPNIATSNLYKLRDYKSPFFSSESTFFITPYSQNTSTAPKKPTLPSIKTDPQVLSTSPDNIVGTDTISEAKDGLDTGT